MNFPDKDEFVVVKVNQILDYGVFVELLEYGKTRGFIHISNVSSSWVKNIRNLVKINQVRVAKVLSTDTEKRQIDLSFAGISPQMEKQKMTDFKDSIASGDDQKVEELIQEANIIQKTLTQEA